MRMPRPSSYLKKWPLVVLGGILALAIGCMVWYQLASRSPDATSQSVVRVEIQAGMTPDDIARELKNKGAITSPLAFVVHAKLRGLSGSLKAGAYDVPVKYSLEQVVSLLSEGLSQNMMITLYPGATLFDPRDIEASKRTDAYTMLVRAGFSGDEIRAAFNGQHTSPLFSGKPASANLEGYLYGETYSFGRGTSLPAVLDHVFETFYGEIQKYNIEEQAKKQGLSLFQAITLASIVEREVTCPNSTEPCEDRKKVAQVFLSRLKIDMPLGSDVTFIYAADQKNQPRRVDFASPYNTRIHKGLPPGPIATPSIGSLRAVVDPSHTDYLYFVAGDDGKTYFSKTNEEHDRAVAQHCHKLCQEL